MMRIRQIGDPILHQVSEAVAIDNIGSSTMVDLAREMKSILDGINAISSDNGNALSAPQVGRLVRLIVLRIDGQLEVMINPEFKAISDETFEFEEECFSSYDLRATVERFLEIELWYLNESGTRKKRRLSGEYAGLVQHEVDHLDGILFLDRVEQAGRKVQSVDELLSDQPARLAQVKTMINYMTG